jgi:hypothetical protein
LQIIEGVKRIDRWNWANSHEFDPPIEVKKILDAHPKDQEYQERFSFCQHFL